MKSLFKKKNLRWAITDKMLFSLFLTGSIIEFSQVGAGFIDGLVISRFLGSEAIAAQGVVQPIYSILGVISGLLAVYRTRLPRCRHFQCATTFPNGRRRYTRYGDMDDVSLASEQISMFCKGHKIEQKTAIMPRFALRSLRQMLSSMVFRKTAPRIRLLTCASSSRRTNLSSECAMTAHSTT